MTFLTAPGRRRGLIARFNDPATLPPDVLEEEITEIVLFRLSLLLNRATGGAADMTFSARTAQGCARGGLRGLCWQVPRVVVDAWCRVMRAEIDHCACALANYHRRRG